MKWLKQELRENKNIKPLLIGQHHSIKVNVGKFKKSLNINNTGDKQMELGISKLHLILFIWQSYQPTMASNFEDTLTNN